MSYAVLRMVDLIQKSVVDQLKTILDEEGLRHYDDTHI